LAAFRYCTVGQRVTNEVKQKDNKPREQLKWGSIGGS
jgi:hypothetical protein